MGFLKKITGSKKGKDKASASTPLEYGTPTAAGSSDSANKSPSPTSGSGLKSAVGGTASATRPIPPGQRLDGKAAAGADHRKSNYKKEHNHIQQQQQQRQRGGNTKAQGSREEQRPSTPPQMRAVPASEPSLFPDQLDMEPVSFLPSSQTPPRSATSLDDYSKPRSAKAGGKSKPSKSTYKAPLPLPLAEVPDSPKSVPSSYNLDSGSVIETASVMSGQQKAADPVSGPGTSITNMPVGDETLATVEITRDLIKRFISDIWNRGEIELIPVVCHPSLRFNGHVGMDRVGHEGFARMVTTVRDALTDYHCEIHSMVVETNKAFCRLRFTGKHTGNLLGFPPTNRTVAWMGASEFTCKNGKILKVWELGDVKSLEDQLKA